MKRPESSTIAWGVLVAGIATYDYLAKDGQTLSEAMDRALESHGRLFAIGAVAVTAFHLLNVLPESIDPIHKLSKLKKHRYSSNLPYTSDAMHEMGHMLIYNNPDALVAYKALEKEARK